MNIDKNGLYTISNPKRGIVVSFYTTLVYIDKIP